MACPPCGKMLIQSARSGPERRRAYAFRLGLYCRDQHPQSESRTLYVFDDEFAAPPIVSNDGFEVLIGNDLLATGRFVLDRTDFRFEWE